ncbi:hypothetical protein, partial [Micromonospora sp. I033]
LRPPARRREGMSALDGLDDITGGDEKSRKDGLAGLIAYPAISWRPSMGLHRRRSGVSGR